MNVINKALLDNGYSRAPFDDPKYGEGFSWSHGNQYEQIYTWNNGYIKLEILHASSPTSRTAHMEEKFKLLDSVFSASFMTELRQQNNSYNQSVKSSVSGDPAYMAPQVPGDEWNTVWAEYNVDNTTIESLPVTFALWFSQVTCPPQYSYCFRPGFPGLEFVGQSSLTYYTIEIQIAPASPVNNGGNG